eukprot:4478776-Amphidinium_carterae.1
MPMVRKGINASNVPLANTPQLTNSVDYKRIRKNQTHIPPSGTSRTVVPENDSQIRSASSSTRMQSFGCLHSESIDL